MVGPRESREKKRGKGYIPSTSIAVAVITERDELLPPPIVPKTHINPETTVDP
jgi:hypothetical protein